MTIQEKFDLGGRVAVVTGGAGLLGAEFCRTLAEAGASVAVADIYGEAAEQVAAKLCEAGHEAKGYRIDISDREAVRLSVDSILHELGRIDILVNSAGLDPKFDASASRK